MTPAAYAVLDVGGTSIKIGAVRGERVVNRPAFDTRSTASAGVVLGPLHLFHDVVASSLDAPVAAAAGLGAHAALLGAVHLVFAPL